VFVTSWPSIIRRVPTVVFSRSGKFRHSTRFDKLRHPQRGGAYLEAIVGHEVAPDDDEADVEDVADVDAEVEADIFVEDTWIDGAITSWPAAAEILEARLVPLGLCGTTLATWPSVILSVDVFPSPPMLSLSASNLLCVGTGGFGLAMASDEVCRGLGVRL